LTKCGEEVCLKSKKSAAFTFHLCILPAKLYAVRDSQEFTRGFSGKNLIPACSLVQSAEVDALFRTKRNLT